MFQIVKKFIPIAKIPSTDNNKKTWIFGSAQSLLRKFELNILIIVLFSIQ